MKGGSSDSNWKQQETRVLGVDEIDKLREEAREPHLSGAYVRNLVKQLTHSSSRPKDTTLINNKKSNKQDGGGGSDTYAQVHSGQLLQQHPQTPKQHKKQVRRRPHTSRPYQERLLNMAEARREIVAALKFHRATMKQQQQQQPRPPQSPPPPAPAAPPELFVNNSSDEGEGRGFSTIYSLPSSSNYMMLDKYFPYTSDNNYNNQTPYNPPASNEYQRPWPVLPNQTLGLNLNLNFQDFCDIEANNFDFYRKGDDPSPSIFCSSYSSSSSSASPPLSQSTTHIDGAGGGGRGGGGDGGDLRLHPMLDDEDMEEIRSIGEQHQIEWDDTLNLVTSAWWLNFLRTMDMELGVEEREHNDHTPPTKQTFEFPAAWSSANNDNTQEDDSCFSSSVDYLQDPDSLW
ncbi:hypothetical protein Ancab_005075 [Ancistrocladus abbreviatus]